MPLKKPLPPLLIEKISRLRLPLAPLLPMPAGAPHADFPSTILAFHLLTEDQLDRLAHYYHQSTPGFWTEQYPVSILWPRRGSASSLLTPRTPRTGRRASTGMVGGPRDDGARGVGMDRDAGAEREWFDSVLLVEEAGEERAQRRWSAILRDDKQRIAIKRRKIGKFIGLVNMQTPKEEVESRMRHDMERTVRRLRREKVKREEEELVRGKWR